MIYRYSSFFFLVLPWANVSGTGTIKRFLSSKLVVNEEVHKAYKNKYMYSNNKNNDNNNEPNADDFYLSIFKPCRFVFYKSVSRRSRNLLSTMKVDDDFVSNATENELNNNLSDLKNFSSEVDDDLVSDATENELNNNLSDLKNISSEVTDFSDSIKSDLDNSSDDDDDDDDDDEDEDDFINLFAISSQLDESASQFEFFTPDPTLMSDLGGHSCSSGSGEEFDDLEIIKMVDRKVFMWPDSNVANGDQCYSLADDNSDAVEYALVNATFFADSSYAMTFPQDATLVSVTCAADHEAMNEFYDAFPGFSSLISWIMYPIIAFGIFILAAIFGIILCVCGCTYACISELCCRTRTNQHLDYEKIPEAESYVDPSANPFRTII